MPGSQNCLAQQPEGGFRPNGRGVLLQALVRQEIQFEQIREFEGHRSELTFSRNANLNLLEQY